MRDEGRQYFGINRPIPISVALPANIKGKEPKQTQPDVHSTTPGEEGDAGDAGDAVTKPADQTPEELAPQNQDQAGISLDLFTFGESVPYATAPVIEGNADLAGLFPQLWTTTAPTVLYAQLRSGSTRIGAPLVLVPLVTPARAVLYNAGVQQAWFIHPRTRVPNFDARKQCELEFITPTPPANYAGLRIYSEDYVTFTTTLGDITFRLRPDQAPNTCSNLRELVKAGFYYDIPVHRIVPRLPSGHPFVVQFGDPTGGGDGGPGYNIQLENSKLPHDFGVLSMARDDDPDTSGSQVFVCLSREGTSRLDGKYTSFAEAVSGQDVINSIAAVKTDQRTQRPIEMPRVVSAKLSPAPPFGTGPAPVKPAKTTER